jgi:hypothetical protein
MKNMTLSVFVCALALAWTGVPKPANATTITETIDFTASGFTPSGAPVDPVIGAFTITLDPTINITGGTTITLDNVNITPSILPPTFDYGTLGTVAKLKTEKVATIVKIAKPTVDTICTAKGLHALTRS